MQQTSYLVYVLILLPRPSRAVCDHAALFTSVVQRLWHNCSGLIGWSSPNGKNWMAAACGYWLCLDWSYLTKTPSCLILSIQSWPIPPVWSFTMNASQVMSTCWKCPVLWRRWKNVLQEDLQWEQWYYGVVCWRRVVCCTQAQWLNLPSQNLLFVVMFLRV